MSDYLAKPIAITELTEALDKLLPKLEPRIEKLYPGEVILTAGESFNDDFSSPSNTRHCYHSRVFRNC